MKDAAEAREITRPALTGYQNFVKTTHSGVCGTDVHYGHAGIGMRVKIRMFLSISDCQTDQV